jgi:hypothetical protein
VLDRIMILMMMMMMMHDAAAEQVKQTGSYTGISQGYSRRHRARGKRLLLAGLLIIWWSARASCLE